MGIIADLMVRVGAETKPFEAGMEKVRVQTEEAGAHAGKFGGLMQGAGLLGLGAVTGIAAFGIAAIHHSMEAGQAAYEMSEKFGISAEHASAYVSVARQLGIETPIVTKGFQTFSKNLEAINLKGAAAETKQYAAAQKALNADTLAADKATQHLADMHTLLKGRTQLTTTETIAFRNAQDAVTAAHTKLAAAQQAVIAASAGINAGSAVTSAAFERLGIHVTDSSGKLRDSHTLMLEAADAFKGMEDGPEKAGLAMKLFGKSGADLIPMLNQGKDGLNKMMEAGKAQGDVMSKDQVEAAHKAFLAHKQFDVALSGVTNKLGVALLPALTAVATFLVSSLIPAVGAFVGWLGNLGPWMPLIGAGLTALGIAIGSVVVPMFIAWTVATWAQVTALAAQAIAIVAATWPLLLLVAGIALVVGAIILVVQHHELIRRKVGEVWGWIQSKIGDFVQWFTTLPARFADIAGQIGSAIFNGIRNGLAGIGNAILGLITAPLHMLTNLPVIGGAIAGQFRSWGIPTFQFGGVVPGSYLGQPQLIVAHAGEVVTPIGGRSPSSGSGPTRVIVMPIVYGTLSPVMQRYADQDVRERVRRLEVGQ